MQTRRWFGPVRVLVKLSGLVGLCAASVAVAGALIGGARPTLAGAAVAFALAFAVYNFDRVADTSPAEGRSTPERAVFVRRSRNVLRVVIPVLLTAALVLAFVRGASAVIWATAFPAMGIAYVMMPLPFRRVRRIKDIPFFKCFYTATAWTMFVGVGVAFSGAPIGAAVAWFAVFVGVRSFASAFLGDLRDVDDDADAGIVTIARALGVTGSHRLLWSLHLFSAAWVIAGVLGEMLPPSAWILAPLTCIGLGLQTAYRRWPARGEAILELYDLEVALYGPCLLLVLA